jgi:hypothetical protein
MAKALLVGNREDNLGHELGSRRRSDSRDPHEPRRACPHELVDPPGELAYLGIDQLEPLDTHEPKLCPNLRGLSKGFAGSLKADLAVQRSHRLTRTDDLQIGVNPVRHTGPFMNVLFTVVNEGSQVGGELGDRHRGQAGLAKGDAGDGHCVLWV